MTENQIEFDSETEVPESGSTTIDMERARHAIRELLEAVGEDPDSEPLRETWQRRVPEAMATLTEGNHDEERPTLRTFSQQTDELIVKTGIPVYSLCEHHLLPYHGIVHVGYRPDGEVIGLSKLPRYVRWLSRRLTTQEGLTADIAEGLASEIGAETVLVQMTATHLCEAMRGIETATETTTKATAGDPTAADSKQFTATIRDQ